MNGMSLDRIETDHGITGIWIAHHVKADIIRLCELVCRLLEIIVDKVTVQVVSFLSIWQA